MPIPGDLNTVTVTGQFISSAGVPVSGTVTFTPSATLLDPSSATIIPAAAATYPLSSAGAFTSDPLIATDNTDLEPQGWAYAVRVELQDLQPYTFACFLPSSPSTVDLSALEPVFPAGTVLGPPGTYLPSSGGTETGTIVLDGSPPLKIPGAADGQILVADGAGNFTPRPNTSGAATSIDGVTVTGITAAGRVIVATDASNATWQLPLQLDTTGSDIKPLAASGSAGTLGQAPKADHVHPSAGLVDTTSTQSIGGAKTFTGEVTVPAPSAASDAVTKTYADSISQGLSVKPAAVAATVGGESFTVVSGSVTAIAGTTLDGVSPAVNDFILIKDAGGVLSSNTANGLYQVSNATTNLSVGRATAMSGSNGPAGAFVFVETGTVNKGAGYVVTTPAGAGAFTYGSGNIQWTQFSSSASVSADGTTLTQSGGVISLAAPVTVARGGTNASTAAAGLANLGGAAVAGDIGGTSASPTVAKIQGTAVDAPSGGTANFLNAAGHWTAPPGSGGASLDTTDSPLALGTAAPGTGPGAAPYNHVHPTAGLLTTAALPLPVGTAQGGTGVSVASGGAALAAMGGGSTTGQVLRGNGSTIGLDAIHATDLPPATSLVQGAVTYDSTTGDVKASPGTAALGGATTPVKAAYVDHVHGQPAMFAPTGLTGATTATRYIGGVSGAAPAGGTYSTGDYAVDISGGGIWVCTAGSSPGPVAWAHIVAGTGVLSNPLTAAGDLIRGGTVTGGSAALTRLGIGTTGQVLTVSSGIPAWAAPPGPSDWINVTLPPYSANNTGSVDATTQIQAAINAAPAGGTVYFPAGTYLVSAPLVVPPAITLQGSGRSLAYDSGSQPMTISTPVLQVKSGTGFSVTATVGGVTVNGVITFVDSTLGGYASGSGNQTVRNITINGTGATAGRAVYGIAAYGAVWGVKLEDVGIFHMPGYGIFTTPHTVGATNYTPDFWQAIGLHVGGCHNDGLSMSSMGDSYWIGCESTGNSGNGWAFNPGGDNIKILGCKAEYNTGIGLVINRGGASRPILISDFGTDGNYQGGIQIAGSGAGPYVINGAGLNYDGQNNGTGGNFAGLSITGGAHVSVTGLNVTTGIANASHLFPQYGIQCPSTFTGSLQIENSEIYGGTAALSLDTTASGVVRFGPDVLTGNGDWANQGTSPLSNLVRAPSPQTTPQQYAKYWSPSAGTSGNWATPTSQPPRESVPWYSAVGNITPGSATMFGAVIPVMPGDVISQLGFVTGATGATLSAGSVWWVALYTAPGSSGTGATLITQCPDQGVTAIAAATAYRKTLNAPYTVQPGVYAVMGAVMINSNGGTQPVLRGVAVNAEQWGGTADLFPGSRQYTGTVAVSSPFTSAPSAPALTANGNCLYLGAC